MTAAPRLRYNPVMSHLPPDASDWRRRGAPTLADIEAMAHEAFARLPETFRALCEDLVIQVDDYATEEVLDDMGIESELDLMGLFQGIGLPFRSESASGQMPNMIWLYRIPMLVYWAEHEETLNAVITHVLVHEIGHHFGMSDDDMEAIEAAADEPVTEGGDRP
jgi:predicted Zn-dependent protease with MMP-like domain